MLSDIIQFLKSDELIISPISDKYKTKIHFHINESILHICITFA